MVTLLRDAARLVPYRGRDSDFSGRAEHLRLHHGAARLAQRRLHVGLIQAFLRILIATTLLAAMLRAAELVAIGCALLLRRQLRLCLLHACFELRIRFRFFEHQSN